MKEPNRDFVPNKKRKRFTPNHSSNPRREESSLRLRWLQTLGGPFIILPKRALEDWKGSYHLEKLTQGIKEVELDDMLNPDLTHYAKACQAAADEVGLLRIIETEVLVLGQEPSKTTIQKVAIDHLRLFRWRTGQDEKEVETFVSTFEDQNLTWSEPINWYLTDQQPIMFDSVMDAEELQSIGRYTNLELSEGLYLVSFAHWHPSPNTSLLVIKIQKEN